MSVMPLLHRPHHSLWAFLNAFGLSLVTVPFGPSLKKLLSGGIADRNDRRVRRLLLDGNRVEPLSHLVGPADQAHADLRLNLALHDRWSGKDSFSPLAKREHQGTVVEVANDKRVDALRIEPEIDCSANGTMSRGEKHRRAVERLGETVD